MGVLGVSVTGVIGRGRRERKLSMEKRIGQAIEDIWKCEDPNYRKGPCLCGCPLP